MDKVKEQRFQAAWRVLINLIHAGILGLHVEVSNLYRISDLTAQVPSSHMSEFLSWLRLNHKARGGQGRYELMLTDLERLPPSLQKYYDDPTCWQELLIRLSQQHIDRGGFFTVGSAVYELGSLTNHTVKPLPEHALVILNRYCAEGITMRFGSNIDRFKITDGGNKYLLSAPASPRPTNGKADKPTDTPARHKRRPPKRQGEERSTNRYPDPVVLTESFHGASAQLMNRFFVRYVDCDGRPLATEAENWFERCGYDNIGAYNQGLTQLRNKGILEPESKGISRWLNVPPEWIAWMTAKKAAEEAARRATDEGDDSDRAPAPTAAPAEAPDDNEPGDTPRPVATPEPAAAPDAEEADEPDKPDIELPFTDVAAAGGEPAPTNHDSNGHANPILRPSTAAIPRLGSRGASVDEFSADRFIATGRFVSPPRFEARTPESPVPIVIEAVAPPAPSRAEADIVPIRSEPPPDSNLPPIVTNITDEVRQLKRRMDEAEQRCEALEQIVRSLQDATSRPATKPIRLHPAADCFAEFFARLPNQQARFAFLDELWAIIEKS